MRRALLLILDGAGYSTDEDGNAVTPELMPNLFGFMQWNGRHEGQVIVPGGPEISRC